MIYLDGSALCRFLPGVRHHAEWGAWAKSRVDELVTTQLGFTELRQAAELYPRKSAERVQEIVDTVRAGVAVIRFSDDNVTISSHATSVLKPFAALHLGAAAGNDKVDTIATYDPALASVAQLYDLKVVSPGLPEDWYLQYEGPPEEWKPIALDAPREPGAEFDVPDISPKPDMYELALREAKAAAEAGPVAEDEEGARDEDAGPHDADTNSDDTSSDDADVSSDDADVFDDGEFGRRGREFGRRGRARRRRGRGHRRPGGGRDGRGAGAGDRRTGRGAGRRETRRAGRRETRRAGRRETRRAGRRETRRAGVGRG